MVRQFIMTTGEKRSLKEFADAAVAHLKDHPNTDEVVQLAENIKELENDTVTAPQNIYSLPEKYEYNFSGFYGQVIGVGRTGIRELHERSKL